MKFYAFICVFILVFCFALTRGEIYYFDFSPKTYLADREGVVKYTLSSLGENLEEYKVRGIGRDCVLWIYDASTDKWVHSNSTWDKFPRGFVNGSLKITNSNLFCEVYLELHSTKTGKVYKTPTKTIWVRKSFGDYLSRYNKNLVTKSEPPQNIRAIDPVDVAPRNRKAAFITYITLFLLAFILGIT